jgi:acetyltransferase
MTIRHLDKLFEPRTVAVIGASQAAGRIGTTVLNNMAGSGFAGALWPVNPKYEELLGIPCYSRVSALPAAPDLAVICTPPDTVPGLIADLGARGTRAAVVLTALPPSTRAAMLKAAQPHLLRILGPGGIGLVSPLAGVNASVAHVGAKAGHTAFISQSGMLMTAVLDYARLHNIGFSRVVSLGEGGDIDLGDLLDFLAGDADTSAIIMHMESVVCARKFMSAARLAARGKPVVVLKSGRDGSDRVIDAAIRRAGMLRVLSSADLFDAVETVARARPLRGERLAVMSNGTSLGLLASDALAAIGGKLADLSPATLKLLKPHLPPGGVAGNPLDIGVAADAERHAAVLQVLLDAQEADALLLIHAPTSAAGSTEVAQRLAPMLAQTQRSVLSCWLGGSGVADARAVFARAGLPAYDTPEKAVRAFRQIVQYHRNQALLIEVPAHAPLAQRPERQAARAIVAAALAEHRAALTGGEASAVLGAYGIALAAPPPGVAATLALRIGMEADPAFGSAIAFGLAGEAGQVLDDGAVGLPPLNMVLARDIVRRSRAGKLLAPQADAICHALVAVAELVADLPEIGTLNIEPLTLGGGAVTAHAASIAIGAPRPEQAMAIRPYPQELEQQASWKQGTLLLRPIRPEDAAAHVRFFAAVHPDDVRLRFFTAMKELPPSQLARLTQIDYDRAMAFIATRDDAHGEPETLGVVRAVADPDNQRAEFAILIRSDLKGQGLGSILFGKLVQYLRSRGTRFLTGEALAENTGVQQLVRRFGGAVSASAEAGMVNLELDLQPKSS